MTEQTVIFLVDDDPTVHDRMNEDLRKLGYQGQIVSSYNPKEAQAKIAKQKESGVPITLIFLDIHMPEMTGIEYLQLLRENEFTEKTPIVMLTTDSSYESIEKSANYKASQYMLKPWGHQELSKNLLKFL